MYEQIAFAFVTALRLYALLGAVFALLFVTLGVQRTDPQAQGAGWGFRLLIFPGVTALWPLLAARWARRRAEPPLERDPHR